MAGSIGFDANGAFQVSGTGRLFGSQLLAYHLLSGQLSLQNSVTDVGMATALFTGTGASLPIATGIDGATQWGNLATEKLGAMYWVKSRSVAATNNMVYDTVRGDNNHIVTDGNAAQSVGTYPFAITSTGFTVNTASTNLDGNGATYVAWGFQTTHRYTGTTNHGQAFTCHYNPFTGFTMIQYTGSGLAGQEIPHMLGRKLGFFLAKNLSIAEDWMAQYRDGNYLLLNTTAAETAAGVSSFTDTAVVMTGARNTAAQNYIMYGWANSYFDVQNNLIGNYELVTWQGTGAAGNKISTRGKPAALLMGKRLDTTSDWFNMDNMRGTLGGSVLFPNLSNAEDSTDYADLVSDGITLKTATFNAAGGQYIGLVIYDNDSGSGKSKYPRATDTSNLNLNAVIPFANGVDASGNKNSQITKNETVSGLALTYGKNYIYCDKTGAYGVSQHAPKYGNYYNGFGDYFDVKSNTWYQSPSIHADSFNTDTSASYTASQATGAVAVINGELKVTVSNDSSCGFKFTKTTVVGKKYRLKFNVSSSAMSNGTLVSTDNNATNKTVGTSTQNEIIYDFVASSASSVIWIFTSNSAAGAITTMFDNLAIWAINNDGSVDLSGATAISNSRNYLDAIVYADNGAVPQPTFVEQLPKTRYEDGIQTNSLNVLSGFNLNQQWYDVTASRVAGATYTNTTGKPILVSVVSLSTGAQDIILIATVGGVPISKQTVAAAGGGYMINLTFTVPNNTQYVITKGASNTLTLWTEFK